MSANDDLYQQVILDHNRKPRNFGPLNPCSHQSEGFNPICGDHLRVYLNIESEIVKNIAFDGDGCAICKASASMMTMAIMGNSRAQAKQKFDEFHSLVLGRLKPDTDTHILGKLAIFSGIWKYPSRVKCAALAWHTLNAALDGKDSTSTEV
jgi:nitrogen fixation protein NifU and related proteins